MNAWWLHCHTVGQLPVGHVGLDGGTAEFVGFVRDKRT